MVSQSPSISKSLTSLLIRQVTKNLMLTELDIFFSCRMLNVFTYISIKTVLWVLLKEILWSLLTLTISVLDYGENLYSHDIYYYIQPFDYELINKFTISKLDEIDDSIIYKSERNPHIIYYGKLFNIEPYLRPTQTIICNKVLKCDISYDYDPGLIPSNSVEAYIFHLKSYPGIPPQKIQMPRDRKHIWALLQEESPMYCMECLDEEFLSLFNFSSTFSRNSNIPFPLLNMLSLNNITSKIFFVETKKKNSYLKEISPILYLQSNCKTTTMRDSYIRELMKYIPIDSYGKCLNNKELPSAYRHFGYKYLERNDFLQFVARYKFVIAIENSVCDDYITEKFWRAIHVGVVPIYFGSSTIRDWLPNEKSAILLEDFPTPQLLIAYIDNLLQDDDLYEQYLEHKTGGIVRNQYLIKELKMRPYQTDFDLVKEKLECLLCEQLHKSREAPLPTRIINNSHYCPTPFEI